MTSFKYAESKEYLMLKYALGGIVLSTSLHSAALSLGASTGSAIIGRPLDISVRSSAPLADIELAGCLQAQVLYGDTTLPAGSVSLSVQGTADGALIRVRSSVPVNEPVVSVVLNTGCAADRFSRKYTLLADLDPALTTSSSVAALPLVVISAPNPPAVAAPAAALAPVPSPASAPEASASGAQTSPPAAPAANRVAPAPAVERAVPAPAPRPAASAPPRPRPPARPRPTAEAPKPATAPAPAPKARSTVAAPAPSPAPAPKVATPVPAPAPAPAPVAAGPRLKLDPVDLSPGRNPGLKLNTELSTPTGGGEAERQAASELWAALNTPPEKAAEDARRLGAMEADLKALREQQASLQASVVALTTQLQAERAERDASAPKVLVYALGAALALVAAALAWLLAERRRERSQQALGNAPWWQSESGQRVEAAPATSAGFPVAPADPEAVSTATVAAAAVPVAPVLSTSEDNSVAALDVTEATESSFAEVIVDSPVSMEALLDLVQQVEFFESLQQQSHAAQLLEQFVQDHPAACELPYLLLMQQAQALGDNKRLVELGEHYRQAFGAPAPEAACYTVGQAGLDSQSKFVDVLTRFWPQEQVLGLLQNTLLAAPGTGLLEQHSLQAYEDALLLYSVAHTLQSDHDLQPPLPVLSSAALAPIASNPTPVPSATPSVWEPAPVTALTPQVVAEPESVISTAAAGAAPIELDLDLSFATEHDIPPPAEPPAAAAPADDGNGRRELPMLDFDLFAIEPAKKDGPPAKS